MLYVSAGSAESVGIQNITQYFLLMFQTSEGHSLIIPVFSITIFFYFVKVGF